MWGLEHQEVKIGTAIVSHMVKDTIGWIVRTETTGRHRYWKVGVANATQAAELACDVASADASKAVTRIPSHVSPAFAPIPGVVSEVVWESRPVGQVSGAPGSEARIGSVGLGEVTFDIVVPEAGVTHVEGCYRVNGGNWQVYYLTNQYDGDSSIDVPIINRGSIFDSGITGISGVLPVDWVLNKKAIQEILAETVGVDGWVEVTGPNSLILK